MKVLEKSYSKKEEILNAITHAIGMVLSVIFMVLLIIKNKLNTNLIISSSIYGICLFCMFLTSTLYHSISGKKTKYVLRILDHLAIFLTIAGTYTIIISSLDSITYTTVFLSIIWLLCIMGMILKLVYFLKYKNKFIEKFSLFLYLFIGWISLLLIKPIINNFGVTTFLFILIGGVLYSIGVYFYSKNKKYFHAIWHVFIMFAASFQFLGIYLFIK